MNNAVSRFPRQGICFVATVDETQGLGLFNPSVSVSFSVSVSERLVTIVAAMKNISDSMAQ